MSLFAATCIVIANMIGTGVFTSLGFQVGGLPSGFVIMLLWLLGGVCALCGALCYAELAAALPRSGGEYHLIGRTLHPLPGFLAGWLSATVGFAAPIALAAMALGKYFAGVVLPEDVIMLTQPAPIGPWQPPALALDAIVALAVVALVTAIHLFGVRIGSLFQNTTTAFKLALIAVVLVAGWLAGSTQGVAFVPATGDAALINSTPFAISLVYVMYAYTGWNAATYIVGEIRDPARNVPRALLIGTGLVTVLYVGLNAVFLRTTPMDALRGKVEVGLVAGQHIFGDTGGRIVAAFICLGLVASVSAMTWIGPRVAATMGEDFAALRWLAKKNGAGVPATALIVQLIIVGVLIVTSTFEKVLIYIQLALTLFSALAVVGLVVLRWRQPGLPRPFRVPLYPLTPLIFLAVSGWMLWHIAIEKPRESLAGLATIAAGLLLYALSPKSKPHP
ncbi:MAG: amino acid permease [Chthoniobacteraceae bacterium]